VIAVLFSLATLLVLSEQPDSKLHLRHPDIICLESNNMEDAIGIVKDILLAGIP
jgi:hypothetical protein